MQRSQWVVPRLKIIVQTYFEKVANYEAVAALPVAGLGLDFVHGGFASIIQKYGFPKDKVLAAGVIDGRMYGARIWMRN